MPSELTQLRDQIMAIHRILNDYEGEEALTKIREILYNDTDDPEEDEEDPRAK